jgi:hypothetical protein
MYERAKGSKLEPLGARIGATRQELGQYTSPKFNNTTHSNDNLFSSLEV